MITQERLKELLNYCQLTGRFVWRLNRGKMKAGDVAGCLNIDKYIRICVDGNTYFAHQLVWLYITGLFPSCPMDHINHIRNDNRFINLRIVSVAENNANSSLYANSSTGIAGVGKFRNKWRARIYLNGVEIHLGIFSDKNDAAISRKMAEYKFGFHENHGEKNNYSEYYRRG